MTKICLTLLMVLTVLSSAAQDEEKKTFKAFGTNWRVFSISAQAGSSVSKEAYKRNLSDLKNVVTSEGYDLTNMQGALDSGYQEFNSGVTAYGAWTARFTIKPLVLSDKKWLSRQEIHIGVSYQSSYRDMKYTWVKNLNQDEFILNSAYYNTKYRQYNIDPMWTIRTPVFGPTMTFYTGLGLKYAIAGSTTIDEAVYRTPYAKANGYYQQTADTKLSEFGHNLKPSTSLMYYIPFGIKKYISCRFNFIAEGYYGRGTTYIKDGGNWKYESSGFQVGLQYKFQKPVKLDNEEGEKKESNKPGVFW